MKPATAPRSIGVLVGLLALCALVGWLGSAVTLPKVEGWYAALHKPFFSPPNWAFGPAWTILYVCMAVAAWRIWRTESDQPTRRRALWLWTAQLVFNLSWSYAFFGAESPLLALVVIVVLEALILAAITVFSRLDGWAAGLMIPYGVWVAYATALNSAILALN